MTPLASTPTAPLGGPRQRTGASRSEGRPAGPPAGPARLRPDDVAECQRILAAGSKSFHAAGRLLPGRVRGPIAALYAFCRVADDAVDLEAAGGKAAALDRLAARLERAYAGAPEDAPVDRAFAEVVRAYRIPRAIPEALLEGFRWDVAQRRYERFDDVVAYAARVASTVGVMMTLLMGERDPATLARACDLGVAMQLTNIARDVGEDAREGRLYLPLAWLREVGIDPEPFIAAPRHDARLARVVRRLLGRAERLYARADLGIPRLPADVRTAMRAARLVYADIGREIAEAGYDAVSRRAHTSAARKAALLALALPAAVIPAPLLGGLRGLGPDVQAPPLAETRFLVDAVRVADAT